MTLKPKRWQEDEPFVAWMLKEGHVMSVYNPNKGPGVKPMVSDGVAIHMWEAFCAGRDSK